ncbi:MAG: rod shape-determining protein RodA [Actinomycetota bacterium]|nr:rod shape-determining protein RodA [Actinomycetota bacterium]
MRLRDIDILSINKKVDLTVVVTVVLLVAYSIVMVYSATQSNAATSDDPYFFIKKQLVALIIGIAALFLSALANYNRWRNSYILLYMLNILMLVLVLFLGAEHKGAQSWIEIGGFQLQPSEISKVLLIITLASFFATRKNQLVGVGDVLLALAHISLPLVLVLVQPDLGTALCYIAILVGMMLVAGFPARYFGYIAIAGSLLMLVAIKFNFLKEYQINRLTVFVNPSNDPQGAGYNLLQSKIAIGSGQFSGKGLLSGTQAKLQFLPERHTDFIFSVVGEELGFLGTAFLLILFFALIMRGLRTAAYSKNYFGTLLVTGVVSLWLFQIIVNIGMTIGLMPITGIPLPFMSYGNSSLISHLAAVGVLLNVYARRYSQ